MGTLTVSRLNDVGSYRSTSYGLSGNDVMEVSLKQTDGYVSSKITLENLKKYITGSSSNYSYQFFDIYYRTINETPQVITIIDGIQDDSSGLYSAWPLFINTNAGIGDTSVNSTGPNWIGKWSTISSPKTVRNTYITFWDKLYELTQGFNINHTDAQKYIKWESISVLNPTAITSTVYMTEYNSTSRGFTSRFLIDPVNGFVALPILNNSFIRTLPKTGIFGSAITDTFASHNHSIQDVGGIGGPGPANGQSGRMTSTGSTGGTETAPKHVTLCPYMQLMNTYAMAEVGSITPLLPIPPIGAMIPIPALTQPLNLSGQGWLYCDGSDILSSTFSSLYSVIGGRFGESELTSTFTLPTSADYYIKYI